MAYSVRCACDAVHAVGATQAGSQLKCACGRTVPIPALSALRVAAGQAAYEVSIADLVQARVKAGELPARGRCVVCGLPAQETLDVFVVCERPILKSAAPWYMVLLSAALLLPKTFFRLHQREHEVQSEQGRETVVRTPLCVDAGCGATLGGAAPEQLRKWLVAVPEYARLLEEYPEATIEVPRD